MALQVAQKGEHKHQGFPYIYHALSLLCANTTSIFDVSHIKFCMCAVNSLSARHYYQRDNALQSRQRRAREDVSLSETKKRQVLEM